MPAAIDAERPSIIIKKESYERIGLVRGEIDAMFNLTDKEFRVEGNLVIVGPLTSDDLVGPVVEFLETSGLVYFDDFCELSGNWPLWLHVFVM